MQVVESSCHDHLDAQCSYL